MLKRVGMLLGVVMCMGLWITEGFAADKTDQGPPSPDRNWQLGFTPSYSSGNFGTGTTSTFFYAPLSIRRMFKDGDVTLVIPFVTATSDGRSTLVGGSPTVVQDNHGGNSGSGSTSCEPGEDKPSCLTGRTAGQKTTTSGLGDIILKGRYYLVEEKDYLPLIAVTGRVKMPTASASQGLGTGELDYGAGIEMSKMLGNSWIAFLDGGYNIIGDPDGLNFQNQYWYDVGAGYYFTKDLLASVYFEEYRAIVPGFVNARDVFFAVNYTASAAWRVNAGVTLGVSNGAPDQAFSIGASYRF
ncbi:MAG: transporter [Nitrospirota bacterium]|nr:transporter [Nitrospirota bacterium]